MNIAKQLLEELSDSEIKEISDKSHDEVVKLNLKIMKFLKKEQIPYTRKHDDGKVVDVNHFLTGSHDFVYFIANDFC